MASEIAQAIFLNNPELIYRAYLKAVAKGNAYAFKELADRAFGKLKERVELEVHPFAELNEQQLLKRIAG